MTIRFYRARDAHGELSNHSLHGFELDGLYWPTIEHYYQAQKFAGTPHAETIRQAPAPMVAKRLGQTRDFPLRPDWEEVKEVVMYQATLTKYETHADVRAVLLGNGRRRIGGELAHGLLLGLWRRWQRPQPLRVDPHAGAVGVARMTYLNRKSSAYAPEA